MTSGRNIMVNFKVNAEELEMLKRGAEEEGMTQSDYIRACLHRDRFLAGDTYAQKRFRENLSAYVKDTGKALQDAIDKLVDPFRAQRKALKAAERPKGGRS